MKVRNSEFPCKLTVLEEIRRQLETTRVQFWREHILVSNKMPANLTFNEEEREIN